MRLHVALKVPAQYTAGLACMGAFITLCNTCLIQVSARVRLAMSRAGRATRASLVLLPYVSLIHVAVYVMWEAEFMWDMCRGLHFSLNNMPRTSTWRMHTSLLYLQVSFEGFTTRV